MSKSYTCNGIYTTKYNQQIKCHDLSGHGTENILQGFENSCNPFFAQLVQDMPLDNIIQTYTRMGIAVNDDKMQKIKFDGLSIYKTNRYQ